VSVYCDPKKVELGFIASRKALDILRFLETCAGAPEPAISLLFPDCARFLRILRGSGYARRCWCPGQDPFWCPVSFPVPKSREEYVARCALGWLAARLVEAGGRIEKGKAIFPTGKAYQVAVWPGKLPEGLTIVVSVNGEEPPDLKPGQLWVDSKDLRERGLRECLQAKK